MTIMTGPREHRERAEHWLAVAEAEAQRPDCNTRVMRSFAELSQAHAALIVPAFDDEERGWLDRRHLKSAIDRALAMPDGVPNPEDEDS